MAVAEDTTCTKEALFGRFAPLKTLETEKVSNLTSSLSIMGVSHMRDSVATLENATSKKNLFLFMVGRL